MGEHLKRADRRAPSWMPCAAVGHQGGVEADLQVGRIRPRGPFAEIVVILDEGLVILEGQRDAGIAGIAGALDQRLAAPAPDLLGERIFRGRSASSPSAMS